jgi:NitT/TauT family transport system ATP-binding protein
MIEVSQLSKEYRATDGKLVAALRDVNLRIKEGEFVCLVGPSGCGKTTLLKIMTGLMSQDKGIVTIEGKPSGISSRCRNGYLSQTDSLLPWRTVAQNVELGLEVQSINRKHRREIALTLIQRMGLTGFEHRYPFELSGGMKKRVSLMRTLAYDPAIIYMDEPFSALDVHTRDMLEDELLCIWEETKKTILFVTHDLYEAISLADRVVLMTARPATIKREYMIDLPRPRTTDIRLTPEFAHILRNIWADLREEVHKIREVFGDMDKK